MLSKDVHVHVVIKNTYLLERLSKKSIDHMRDNFSLDNYLLQEFEDYKLLLVS